MSDANSSLTIRVGASGIDTVMSEFSALTRTIANLAPAIAAFTSVGGFAMLAEGGLQLAEAMSQVRQIVGVTIGDMTGLAYAGNKVDISTSQMTVGLKKFSEYLVKTGQSGKSMKEALMEQSAIFQTMPDGVEKTARAVELFGRSGTAMIPLLNQGPKALEAMIERGGELSGVTDQMGKNAKDFSDSLKDVKMASEGLAATLVSPLLPSVASVIEHMTNGLVAFREWTQQSAYFKIALEAVTAGLVSFFALNIAVKLTEILLVVRALPAALFAAGAAVLPLTITLAALTAVIVAVAQAWGLYKDKQNEALSAKNAQSALTGYGEAIQHNIDAQMKVGALAGEQGADMKRSVSALTDEWQKGTLTLDEYRKRLDAIASKLRETNPLQAGVTGPARPDDDLNTLRHSGRQLELARLEADAVIKKAAIATEEKENDELYRLKLISVQDYYAKKRQLDEANEARERAILQKKLEAVSEDLRVNDSEQRFAMADPGTDNSKVIELEKKRNALLGEQAKIMGQLGVLSTQNAALDAIYAAKAAQETIAQNLRLDEQARKITELKYANAKSSIEGNPDLSEQQKATAMLAVNRAQQDYIAAQIQSTAQDALSAKSQEDRNKYTEQSLQLEGQRIALLNDEEKLKAQSGDWGANFRGALTGIQNQWGSWASQMAGTFSSVFNSAISSVSNGITGLIMGTKTWKQALMDITNTILTSIIGAIVQMGVRWVLTQLMMAVFGKAMMAASTAALIPVAAAQAGIWWTPAVLSTIASFGASAAAAPLEVGAAILAGFDEGGYTAGKRGMPAGIVHGEEFVFSAPAVDRIGLPTLQAIHTGATVAGSRSTAGSSGGGAAGGQKNSPVNLHFYDSRPHPKDFLASSEGENMVVNIARKNRLKIGVGT